jgi:hypothetical protein
VPFEIPLKGYLYKYIETDNNPKQYLDVYFDFENDYQRSNPITLRDGFIKYTHYLVDKKIISDDEFKRIKSIINNDEAWRFLRNQEQPTCYTSRVLNRNACILEAMTRKSSFFEKGRIRKVAIKKFLNIFNMEEKEEYQDFGDLLLEIEAILLQKKSINTRQRNEVAVFKNYMTSSKFLIENLKEEYKRINSNDKIETEDVQLFENSNINRRLSYKKFSSMKQLSRNVSMCLDK